MVFVFIDEEYKMSKTLQQKADEARNMCKLKAVEFFTQKAKSVETEACQIKSEIQPLEDSFLMQMWIEFSCQAEVVLFQMAVR